MASVSFATIKITLKTTTFKFQGALNKSHFMISTGKRGKSMNLETFLYPQEITFAIQKFKGEYPHIILVKGQQDPDAGNGKLRS